jgi:hypothetical protein
MKDMVERYEPDLIFADGDWMPANDKYWKSADFLAWLFNERFALFTLLLITYTIAFQPC